MRGKCGVKYRANRQIGFLAGVQFQNVLLAVAVVFVHDTFEQQAETPLGLAANIFRQLAARLLALARAKALAHIVAVYVNDGEIVLALFLTELIDLRREFVVLSNRVLIPRYALHLYVKTRISVRIFFENTVVTALSFSSLTSWLKSISALPPSLLATTH